MYVKVSACILISKFKVSTTYKVGSSKLSNLFFKQYIFIVINVRLFRVGSFVQNDTGFISSYQVSVPQKTLHSPFSTIRGWGLRIKVSPCPFRLIFRRYSSKMWSILSPVSCADFITSVFLENIRRGRASHVSLKWNQFLYCVYLLPPSSITGFVNNASHILEP